MSEDGSTFLVNVERIGLVVEEDLYSVEKVGRPGCLFPGEVVCGAVPEEGGGGGGGTKRTIKRVGGGGVVVHGEDEVKRQGNGNGRSPPPVDSELGLCLAVVSGEVDDVEGGSVVGYEELEEVEVGELHPGGACKSGTLGFDDNNMVAAMNEHLNSSSGVRTTLTTSTTTTAKDFQPNNEDADKGILSFPCDFDHMYASMTDGGAPATSALGVSPLRGNEARQNDLTEVKHLKELLLLHLDLIQQQSEQIVTKDKLLAALRQENETLKLRLERMDRRVNLQKLRSESSENSNVSDHVASLSPSATNSVTVPSTSEIHRNIQSECNSPQFNESFKIRLNTSGGITTVKQEYSENQDKYDTKQESSGELKHEWEGKKKRRSDLIPLGGGSKRKRGISCSSAVSNDTSPSQDKLNNEGNRKSDKKGKGLVKKESFLITEEHYYTALGEPGYTLNNMKEPIDSDTSTSLEVPNWRVKIYTSCYTMEGTENLDDEIFNKRHLKLENDERRRKRWDVQRIREQRHIEKLKQRQERQNHQATCYNTNHTGPCPSAVEEEAVTSLWPDIDQIQSLQVDTQLPVTAFGAPIPSFTPSEFILPWLGTMRSKNRRPKRSTGRRKSCRR
ncbi:male-specific lethal 1-like 1 [Prorops nasuta]|uniref:male-specific lethal 1-like 1 n=1 Tax=Prorops nasuta TaxID=863751 RepID=UPI0034CD884B